MPGATAELIEREIQGRFNLRERTVSVGDVVTELMGGDPERVSWLIVNMGGVEMRVGWTQEITATDGIQIVISGGNFAVNVRDDFIISIFPLYGIVAAATTNVRVIEIFRETT